VGLLLSGCAAESRCQRSPSSSTQVGAGLARQGLLEAGLAANDWLMTCVAEGGRLMVVLEIKVLFMDGLGMDALVMDMAETRLAWTERVWI
jgi:hypothetical protein